MKQKKKEKENTISIRNFMQINARDAFRPPNGVLLIYSFPRDLPGRRPWKNNAVKYFKKKIFFLNHRLKNKIELNWGTISNNF